MPNTTERLTRQLQNMLIDFEPYQTDLVEVVAYYKSSEFLGGDYISLLPREDGRFHLSIGDVMGKGLTAGFLMGTLHGTYKGITLQSSEPNQILSLLNKALIRDFQRYQAFSTFLVSLYNPENRLLQWANAGQNYPLLWRKETQKCEPLELKGVMIGVVDHLQYSLGETRIHHGDVVFWYTDGLVELMNESRQLYGIDRVIQIIESFGGFGAKEIVERLEQDLIRFSGTQGIRDDISFIVLRCLTEGG